MRFKLLKYGKNMARQLKVKDAKTKVEEAKTLPPLCLGALSTLWMRRVRVRRSMSIQKW